MLKHLLFLPTREKNTFRSAAKSVNPQSPDNRDGFRIGPRRIAYLSSHSEIAGGERVLLDFCRRIDQREFIPHVILPREGGLASELRRNGIEVAVIPFRRDFLFGYPPAWSNRACREIGAQLKIWRVSLIHIHDSYLTLLAGRVGRILHIPVALTAHGTWDSHFFFQDWLNQKYLQMIWAPSHQVVASLLRRGWISRQRVRRVPFGIDTEKFLPRDAQVAREKLKIPSGAIVVARVARFDDAKDYPTFLRAAQELVEKDPRVYFLVLGDTRLQISSESDGNKRAFHAFLSTHPRLSARLLYLGHQDDVPFYLSAADLLVSSSSSESFPLNVLEAMAMQLPIVTTAVGGVAEIVEEGVTGILVPPKNHRALADGMAALLDEPQKRQQMGARGRDRVKSFFSLTTYVEQMQIEYRNLLQGPL